MFPEADKPRALIRDIINVASRLWRIPAEDIKSKRQLRLFARPRQAICLIAGRQGYTATQIGNRLGGRDHSTILHSQKVAQHLMRTDPGFAMLATELMLEAAIVSPFETQGVAPPPVADFVPKPKIIEPEREAHKMLKNRLGAAGEGEQARQWDDMRQGSAALAKAINEARAI